jgi:hypothetical protein
VTAKLTRTIVPAAPGWSVAFEVSEVSGSRFDYEPIVAWCVVEDSDDDPDNTYADHVAHPITTDQNANETCRRRPLPQAWVFRDPAGVHRYDGYSWGSAEEAIRWVQSVREQRVRA